MIEVKAGYKQTALGVIPEDWDVLSIEELITKGFIEKPLDGNHGNIHPKSGDFVDNGIPFVMANNVYSGFVDLNSCHFIRKEQADSLQKGFSITGDVLLTHKGTVGNVAIVGKIDTEYIMLTPQVTYYRVKNSNAICNTYIKQYFLSNTFQEIIKKISGGGTRAYIGITSQRQLPFVLPSIKEQNTISTVLSDTDALIEHLEKLIAKKKAIKQGTMQQLLTGKKRLPGFSGKWNAKKLRDLLDYEQPTEYLVKDTEYNDHNSIPVLTAGKTFILGYTDEEFGVFNNIPVIIFDDFTTANKYVTVPFKAKSSAMKMLKPKDININLRFIFEKMQLIVFPLGDHKRYWISEYQNLYIELPKPEEQSAIATILSDMDSEIEALEQTRDKYTMIKQGMMQQLLTGRIRIHGTN